MEKKIKNNNTWEQKAKKGRSRGVEGSQADQESTGGPQWVGDPWKCPPGFRYIGHPSVLHISLATPGQKAFPAIVTRVPFTHCGNLQVPEGCLPSSCAAAQFAPVRATFCCPVCSSEGCFLLPGSQPQGSLHLKMALTESEGGEKIL